jgi:hypothetical protein
MAEGRLQREVPILIFSHIQNKAWFEMGCLHYTPAVTQIPTQFSERGEGGKTQDNNTMCVYLLSLLYRDTAYRPSDAKVPYLPVMSV